MTRQKFDALAAAYDQYRPRYPRELLRAAVEKMPRRDAPRVVDCGAGTGVALEVLLPLLPDDARVEAVDVSEGMVARGRAKFPDLSWCIAEAEPFLERASDVALVIAAQSYQWMDRPRYLRAAHACLVEGGCLAILQNNRDFAASAFLDAYESLLEQQANGYSRTYRAFDIAAELRDVFGNVEVQRTTWQRQMHPDEFVGMTQSSTQVQRALDAHGEEFERRLGELIDRHAPDGVLVIPYSSEIYLATSPGNGRAPRRPSG